VDEELTFHGVMPSYTSCKCSFLVLVCFRWEGYTNHFLLCYGFFKVKLEFSFCLICFYYAKLCSLGGKFRMYSFLASLLRVHFNMGFSKFNENEFRRKLTFY